MRISDKIWDRMANIHNATSSTNVSQFIEEGELDELVDEVAVMIDELLYTLIIWTKEDHNTKDTAKRVAKMLINEIFSGRYKPRPEITSFPNAQKYDELYVTGPITIRSTCAHHLMPIKGVAYIGVFPGTDVVGLSKFNRIVDWIASRPQIQEEMTIQIAKEVEDITKAEGVGVIIQAEHFCMTHRGVREHNSMMTTSAINGVLREKPHLKQEFLSLVKMSQDRR